MTGCCIRCRRSGEIHRHHLTGFDLHARYLHPLLTVPLCVACHDGAHLVLRAASLDGNRAATPLLVMARICAWLSWMSEAPGPHQLLLEELTRALEEPLEALIAAMPLIGALHG